MSTIDPRATAAFVQSPSAYQPANPWPKIAQSASAHSTSSPAGLKLRKAAAEFESTLISNLWKSMKTTFADSEDDDSTDPAKDTLNDFGIHSMATAVANAGGFGIGALILKHLEPQIADSQNGNQLQPRKDSGPPADIPQ